VNGPYANSAFAVLTGLGGTVSVDNANGQVRAAGMQFAVDGYKISGQPLTLTGGSSFIRVGDGTSAGIGMTATISSVLQGSADLVKSDLGTLVLAGNNTYTGATTVSAGGLFVNGDQTAATGPTFVNSGATLGGSGIIGGDVSIADGGVLPRRWRRYAGHAHGRGQLDAEQRLDTELQLRSGQCCRRRTR
jgi:fibronectin-binding autotransporter adhesin